VIEHFLETETESLHVAKASREGLVVPCFAKSPANVQKALSEPGRDTPWGDTFNNLTFHPTVYISLVVHDEQGSRFGLREADQHANARRCTIIGKSYL